MPALCPAWKRGHCIREGWCPRQHPRPAADDWALPAVGHAAASTALRYGVAQSWILDETTRGSVNIQEPVDLVAHTGQTEVALHTQGRHGGPAEGIVVEPTGMVLVLAADMVRGLLHASRVRRARPQWTIQVYIPPRAWPFSTWAVLAVMWHLSPEGTPTGTAEEIARDSQAWPADQDFPWRRRQGGLPVAPAAEGFSLVATLQRHPDKRGGTSCRQAQFRPLHPTPGGGWTRGRQNRYQTPESSRRGTYQRAPWPMPAKPSRELSHRLNPPALPCSAAYRRGRPGYGGEKRTDARARTSPWCRARRCFTPRTWQPWKGGQSCPNGMQMDNCGRPATHAIASGVPLPSASGPPLAPRHALTREVWRAMLSHPREWMATPGAR